MVQENLNVISRNFASLETLSGLLPGMVLGYVNLSILKWTFENRVKSQNAKRLIIGLFFARLMLLVIVLYVAYLMLGPKFVIGLALGMLVHKLFFVTKNLSEILFKRNI